MNIELINTGSELLLGRVLNTHQHWLGRRLADRGYEVARQVAVPDTGPAIQSAVSEAMTRANLVIATGGLGPTSDDRTRDLIAELLNRSLIRDETIADHIRGFFERRGRTMPESVLVQALVPEGATVFMNQFGTAPGLAVPLPTAPGAPEAGVLILLPGPPRELRPMFADQVLPWLCESFLPPVDFACRTLRSTGIGESRVEEALHQDLQPLLDSGLELGYCARSGEVDVRLVARGKEADSVVTRAAEQVYQTFGNVIFGEDDDVLEQVIVRELKTRGQTVSMAESCTGGFLAHRMTNVSGSSEVFESGVVTYSNASKVRLLGVEPELLERHGAVSKPVAQAMATGARERAGTDYAVAVTGIAGPTGGTDDKPVGTVFIAVADERGAAAIRCFNPVEREAFKYMTSQQAFEILRRKILKQRPMNA